MKILLLTFIFIPFMIQAQECKLNKSTDPYTKEVKLSSGFIPVTMGGNKMSVSGDVDAKEINFLFFFPNAGESKCFDENSSAIFIYEGERFRTNFKNTGAMNCEGYFQMSFRNVSVLPSNLTKLASKKLSTLRFIGNRKDTTTIVLTEDQKLKLMTLFDCVSKESRSLLPQQ